ncbi:CLUMA_CG015664, isoform A [Clunio marinus]|uniref:CLUMA_CG015664, isoform A n=1 Tax=Clunio marinus TaxID=568069 RepID=A0A1J1IR66_9DIPT|nr:CLUMA_CG015664, isoform A [Clunio marinus]
MVPTVLLNPSDPHSLSQSKRAQDKISDIAKSEILLSHHSSGSKLDEASCSPFLCNSVSLFWHQNSGFYRNKLET